MLLKAYIFVNCTQKSCNQKSVLSSFFGRWHFDGSQSIRMPCSDIGQSTIYFVAPVNSLFFSVSRNHVSKKNQNNTSYWFIKIMNYLNAISQPIIYQYSKTWFITNMQGCYVPFWDRVQGPSELGKLATFWDIGENCAPFKWGAKLIFSFKFTAFKKNCVLSLKGQKSRWIF